MALLNLLFSICLASKATQALKSNTHDEISELRQDMNGFRQLMETENRKLQQLISAQTLMAEQLLKLEDENKRLHGLIAAQTERTEVYERSHVAKSTDVKASSKKEVNGEEIEAKKTDVRSGDNTFRTENRFLTYGCLNQNIQLSCDGDRQINITSAFYGEYHETCEETCCVPHPTDECWENMETSKPSEWLALIYLCQNQTDCVYEYRSTTFANTCSIGTAADFVEIYYSCSPGAEGEPVAFSAGPTAIRDYQSNQQVLFDSQILNAGGHYQTDASRFICPYDGIYMFSVTALSGRPGDKIYGRIKIEAFEIGVAFADATSGSYSQGAVTVVAECLSGQRVWVLHDPGVGSMLPSLHSVFSGYMLYKY